MTDDSAPAAASLTAASLCHLWEQPRTLNITFLKGPLQAKKDRFSARKQVELGS